MPRHKNESKSKTKLRDWVKKNPNGYLENSYETIGEELRISHTTVMRHLNDIIAERDGILPSEVTEKRKKKGMLYGARKLQQDTIYEIISLSKNYQPVDIAYKLKLDVRTVNKYLNEQKIRELSPKHNAKEIAEKLKIDVEIVEPFLKEIQKEKKEAEKDKTEDSNMGLSEQ